MGATFRAIDGHQQDVLCTNNNNCHGPVPLDLTLLHQRQMHCRHLLHIVCVRYLVAALFAKCSSSVTPPATPRVVLCALSLHSRDTAHIPQGQYFPSGPRPKGSCMFPWNDTGAVIKQLPVVTLCWGDLGHARCAQLCTAAVCHIAKQATPLGALPPRLRSSQMALLLATSSKRKHVAPVWDT